MCHDGGDLVEELAAECLAFRRKSGMGVMSSLALLGSGLDATVLRIGAARFFFYSNEGSEAPHIHIEQAGRLPSSGSSLYHWLHRVGSGGTRYGGSKDK